MNPSQRNQRLAAAKAFMESLDQLQDVLGSEEGKTPPPASPAPQKLPQKPPKAAPPEPELADWEQAVADIDAFMQGDEGKRA